MMVLLETWQTTTGGSLPRSGQTTDHGQPDLSLLGLLSDRGDFYRIHSEWMREGKSHSGIILGTQQHYSVGEQMRRLLRLINRLTAEEMQNRIEFLTAWGVRKSRNQKFRKQK
jgi:Tfp pilus assembly protein PilZ